MTAVSPERARKFRQAAIAYLHYAALYWFGAYALFGAGLLPEGRGPAWMWLAIGGAIGLGVTAALWFWRSPWFARILWAVVALRLPALVEGAFLGGGAEGVPPALYLAAGVVVLAVLWMLARAAWDV
ncbi:MAG TPA: hypothetical protein VM778_05220 [Gemmatimonadota bacterium]|nr:hypothetical protein [Gemmatimonadota bacterium]